VTKQFKPKSFLLSLNQSPFKPGWILPGQESFPLEPNQLPPSQPLSFLKRAGSMLSQNQFPPSQARFAPKHRFFPRSPEPSAR